MKNVSNTTNPIITKIGFNIPVVIVLFVALYLRLISVESMSLSNDELSSMWRSLLQPTWHDMMVHGVMTDGHPPLTYVIMRLWVSMFGDSVFSIRLPFIMAGVLGLYYTYRTGVLWFGHSTALLSVSFLAFSSYVIYYHQIARPYAFGFLWVQASVYYWTCFLFYNDEKGKYQPLLLWILMAVLSCYTHYFSLMAVALIGLTGLFFLRRDTYRMYLLSGIVIGFSLLPGVAIFRHQLSYDGLGWLPAPDHWWLWHYISYTLNDSLALFIIMGCILSLAVLVGIYKGSIMLSRFHLIGMAWFLISFAIGYAKSVYSMPVLQYSCLIFTFPFLVQVFFRFGRMEYPKHIYTC